MKALRFETEVIQEASKKTERESFARARDFALVLTPITIGVAYRLLTEFFSGASHSSEGLFTGLMHGYWLQDASAIYHLFIFGLFLLGIGAAIWLLSKVKEL